MYRLLLYIIVLIALMLPFTAAAATMPEAAKAMAKEIDEQIMRRVEVIASEEPFLGRSSITIAATVPVHLSKLEESSPLARQMSEEMSRALSSLGYHIVEIRKAQDIKMTQPTGEVMLTRDVSKLAIKSTHAVAVLTGTYLVTPDNVRFNMKIVKTANNNVLGMSSATVPVTREIMPLLRDKKGAPLPSVLTRLP